MHRVEALHEAVGVSSSRRSGPPDEFARHGMVIDCRFDAALKRTLLWLQRRLFIHRVFNDVCASRRATLVTVASRFTVFTANGM